MNKVLVVDDNDIELEIIDNALSTGGYKVIKLKSVHSIVDICSAVKPFCILLDLNMPYKSGIDAYKELQESYKTSNIPVIFITSSTELREECNNLNSSINSFFEKPVKWDSLIDVLKSKEKVSPCEVQALDIQSKLKDIINKLSDI